MNRIITWGESLSKKQTINICLRAAAITFMFGVGAGMLMIKAGVIG